MRHLRVLVHERGGVVDLIVDDYEDVLLSRVLCNLGESEFFGHDV